MGLMMLSAAPGCTIHVETSGKESAEVMAALSALVANRFGEEE
jgi:phosphocarrier protein